MNARTQIKHPPLISNTMAGIAFTIHIILSVINFNFTTLINGIGLHQSNINTLILAVIQPVLVATLVAPILCIVRHTDFLSEFRNILFLSVGLFVVHALADVAGIFR